MLARRGAARRQIGATAGSPLRSRRCPTNGDKYQALDFARMMSLPRVVKGRRRTQQQESRMTVRARTPSRRPISWSTCPSRTWPTTATPGHRHATGAPPFSSRAGSSCSLMSGSSWRRSCCVTALGIRSGTTWPAAGAPDALARADRRTAPRRCAPFGWLCAVSGLWLIASKLWVNATGGRPSRTTSSSPSPWPCSRSPAWPAPTALCSSALWPIARTGRR